MFGERLRVVLSPGYANWPYDVSNILHFQHIGQICKSLVTTTSRSAAKSCRNNRIKWSKCSGCETYCHQPASCCQIPTLTILGSQVGPIWIKGHYWFGQGICPPVAASCRKAKLFYSCKTRCHRSVIPLSRHGNPFFV